MNLPVRLLGTGLQIVAWLVLALAGTATIVVWNEVGQFSPGANVAKAIFLLQTVVPVVLTWGLLLAAGRALHLMADVVDDRQSTPTPTELPEAQGRPLADSPSGAANGRVDSR